MEYPQNAAFSVSPMQKKDTGEISKRVAAMDPWLTLGYKPETLSYYLLQADPSLRRYSVTIGDSLAGVLTLRHPWLFGPFIELLALFDGFRGMGVGRGLISWTCNKFSPQNLWVTVSSFNLRAQKFYFRVGFERAALLDDLIKPGWDEILLRKRAQRPAEQSGDGQVRERKA